MNNCSFFCQQLNFGAIGYFIEIVPLPLCTSKQLLKTEFTDSVRPEKEKVEEERRREREE